MAFPGIARVALVICHATYHRVAVRSFRGGGSIGALQGQLWLRLEEANNKRPHAVLHQMRSGGGVAGRMGTERSEIVRTP